MITPKQTLTVRRLATKELALFAGFLFLGLVIMPFAIYFVGDAVFGPYAGAGYGDFFGTLSDRIRTGDRVAWFLVLAPYFGWQILRLLAFAWRLAGTGKSAV